MAKPKHPDMIVILNDDETWTTIEGTHIVVGHLDKIINEATNEPNGMGRHYKLVTLLRYVPLIGWKAAEQ